MQFRFTLIDFTFNPAGVTTVLDDEPVGWDALDIIIKRDLHTHGIFFEYSLNNLGFINEAYTIIKTAYDDSGSEAFTNLLIEVKCSDTGAFEEVYTGRLVYARIKFEHKDYCIVNIPVEQKSCLQKWRSRLDAKVDLTSRRTFSSPTVDNLDEYVGLQAEVQLPSKPIVFLNGAEIELYDELLPIITGSGTGDTTHQRTFGVLFNSGIRQDFESFAPDFNNWDDGLPILIVDSLDIDCGTNQLELLIELNLNIEFSFQTDGIEYLNNNPCGSGNEDPIRTDVKIKLIHQNSDGDEISTEVLYESQECVPEGISNLLIENSDLFQNNFTPVTSPGDRFFLVLELTTSSMTTWSNTFYNANVTFNSGKFEARLISECEDSTGKVFLINEALSRTSEIISDDCLRVYSDYFGRTDAQPYASDADGCGALETITNGLFIRRAKKTDGTDPQCFVSMKGMFDSLNGIHNICMVLEDDPNRSGFQLLRIEPVSYAYKTNVLLTLDNVREIERSFEIKRAISLINIGYKQWESEFNGGLDEFLTKREYRTELTQVETKLDILSDFIASGYAIEITRRKGATSEDFKYDNNIFIVCVERIYGGYSAEVFDDLDATNLLSDENVYNVRISPFRNLLRWHKSIRTINSDRFRFNAGEGNYIAVIGKTGADACLLEQEGNAFAENASATLNSFEDAVADATPIWLPETISFEYPLSYEEFKLIQADPTATIRITQGGLTMDGFIEEMSYKIAEGMAKFKLLREWE